MTSVLVVVSLLAAVCAALGMLPVDITLETAVGLSTLILAISSAVAILGTVKKVNKSAIAGVAGVAVVVGALAAVLGVLNKYDFNVSIETATAMSELILALSTSCAILGSISGIKFTNPAKPVSNAATPVTTSNNLPAFAAAEPFIPEIDRLWFRIVPR